MVLSAMVSQSTFEEIAGAILPCELQKLNYVRNYVSGGTMLQVIAEAKADKILALAKQNVAGLETNQDFLPEFDRLLVAGYSEAKDRFGTERVGVICFWNKNAEERF